MAIRIPADRPCPAFGTGCGGFLNSDGVCSTCGAVERPSRDEIREAAREPDDDFDPPGPYDDYTERDLEELADEAADRYERWLFGED